MKRTAQDNAREFRQITKQGYGVHLAVLVACSVEEGTAGRPSKNRPTLADSKVSATVFARVAEVSRQTVINYLDKWDRMVAAGWDVDRENLTPSDVDTLQLSDKFITEFDALAVRDGGTTENGLTGKAADIAKNTKAMAEAIKADPKVAEAARQALAQAAAPSDEFSRKAAHAAERAAARKERAGWLFYRGRLSKILSAVQAAMRDAGKPGRFTGDERDDLLDTIARAEEGLAMLRSCISGETVDWDAALAALTQGESK